jgi:hypothetical protein
MHYALSHLYRCERVRERERERERESVLTVGHWTLQKHRGNKESLQHKQNDVLVKKVSLLPQDLPRWEHWDRRGYSPCHHRRS